MKRYTVYLVGKEHPYIFNGDLKEEEEFGWMKFDTDRGFVKIQEKHVASIEEQEITPA